MPDSARLAGELTAPDVERTPRPPKFKRRRLPLEQTPHRFAWLRTDIARTRPKLEDVEILR